MNKYVIVWSFYSSYQLNWGLFHRGKSFDTEKEARDYLLENFLDDFQSYHEDEDGDEIPMTLDLLKKESDIYEVDVDNLEINVDYGWDQHYFAVVEVI